MWQCSHCTKKFKYESEKKRHEQSHVPQFECKVCAKKFSFQSALRRHEKQHDRTGSVQCSKCGGCFRDDALLKRHLLYAHKGTFSCTKCSSLFSSEAALNTHMKTHKPEAERQFRCDFPNCTKSFNFSHHLKHHQLTHTDDKQHFCSVCGKGFIQSYHLKIHMKTHEPEAWLPCSVDSCNKKFANEYARKRHLATHKNKASRRASSDSKRNSNTPVPVLVAMLCPQCGDLVTDKHLASHKDTCVTKEQTEPEDLSVTSLGISINEISDHMEAETREKASSDGGNKIEDMEVSTSCKCKLLLHDDTEATEAADSQNDECFCDKVTKNLDDFESNTTSDINDLQVIKLYDYITKSSEYNKCYRCECANMCTDDDKSKQICQFDMTPEIECNSDGVIKIKDSFDVDIGTKIDYVSNNNDAKEIVNDKKNIEPVTETKLELSDLNCVQFNTCEDVLGKCIVSETGTISDECLCAKMSAADQQMISREIEELTPCPKKNTWFNIKYKVRL